MRTHPFGSLTAATLALCLVTGGAAAQGQGHEKEHGNGHEKDHGKWNENDHRRGNENDHEQENNDERGNGNRNHRVIVSDNGTFRRIPPGLAKKGGLPPGQARKHYRATDGVVALRDVFGRHGYTIVRTQPYGSSQYVYYRQGNGLVQRAVVVPGSDRLTFQNVPQMLLQEVLARLY